VEEISFSGAYEQLRLRLPPIPGVRPISPRVSFGSNSFLVDATRSPEQANRFPLGIGDKAWVGVHRIHALAHPGLNFLIVTDGSLRSRAAISLGGQIGRFAHARVTLLGCAQPGSALEPHLEEARKQLGSGLAAIETLSSPEPTSQAIAWAAEKSPYDLVILGFNHQEDIPLAENILGVGEHHLLLVPQPQSAPSKALICVAIGEPGKDDVLFAGRLVRHLSAEATLLSVTPALVEDPEVNGRIERFMEGGVRSLSLFGVPTNTVTRFGSIPEEIFSEVQEKGYDLVVLGAPLSYYGGKVSLSGVIDQILEKITDRSILIVRSHYYRGQIDPTSTGKRKSRGA
jgi:nucleotide-binding universal stress UspA family protein